MPANVKTSLSTIRTDPMRNFKFLVQIPHIVADGNSNDSLINIGFLSLSGLSVSNEVTAYREGGNNTSPQYLPGQSQFSPITLQRGIPISGASRVWNWAKQVFAVSAGSGFTVSGGEFRVPSIDIKVLAHPVTKNTDQTSVQAWYRVYRAWPSAISYSDLDAGGNGYVVETLTLAHEGFEASFATDLGQDAAEPPAY